MHRISRFRLSAAVARATVRRTTPEVNAMNQNPLSDIQAGIPLAVDAKPMPLRLPKGSAIFAYRSEIWLTQEGMFDDVILAPGERFDVKSRDLILATATRGSAYLVVATPLRTAECSDRDLFAFLGCGARRLRDEQFDAAVSAARRLLSGLADAPVAHVRRWLAPSGQVPGLDRYPAAGAATRE
jgi:Protein of unknown function (DUF2917)